jgi:hypothetical protein
MKRLRATLWLSAAILVMLIIVMPAFDKNNTIQSTSAAPADVMPATPSAPAWQGSKLSFDYASHVMPTMGGAQRNALIVAAAALALWAAFARLTRRQNRQLQAASPKLYVVRPFYSGPIIWNHDIENIESIGSVGLMHPMALPVLRQQAQMVERELVAA